MMNREEERLLNRHALYDKHKIPLHSVLLLSVGMMREGAKFESYKILANALARMDTKKEWNLVIIGDGPLRSKVESLFNKKIIFAGQLTSAQLQKYYSSADIFLWPAVNEAYGMALLEAQSAGVPAVAGDSGGVKDILRDKKTGLLSIEGDADDFANKTCKLIDNANFRKKLSYNALRIASRDHSFESNSKKIGTWVLETREYFKRL